MNPIERINEYRTRLATLKTERSEWDTHWKELNDYLQPRTSRFFVTDKNKGGKVNHRIIDSSAGFALRTFSAGLMAGMTSPARPWFQLATADPDLKEFKPVKTWLYTVAQNLREVFAKSNLYYILPDAYRNLGLYGTAAFSVLPDWDQVIRCYPFPTGSFVLALSERGNVDTCIREYSYTVRQLVNKFGRDKCSASVRNAYDTGNYDEWVDVVHVVTPREEREHGKILSKDKPFASVWFEKKADEGFLAEWGFDDFPVMAPRWDVLGEDTYGHSPAMEVLGDVKSLQLESKKKLEGIEKVVNPPMLADVSLRNTRVSTLPGDVTYVANLAQTSGMRSVYESNPDLNHLTMDISEVQRRIRQALYADVMMMFADTNSGVGANITAREVEERHQEKLLILGPYMERLNNELLNPLIDRAFSVMTERGLIPPPPEELQGQDLKVEYISMMAQAQKLIGIQSLERLVGFVGNVAGVQPSVLDKLDIDQCVDEYADMVGAPPRSVRSDDEVEVIRQQRAQAEQAAKLAEMAQPLQQAAQGAKLLSETDVTDVSALTRLMGAA